MMSGGDDVLDDVQVACTATALAVLGSQAI